jgi:hypothetical protein
MMKNTTTTGRWKRAVLTTTAVALGCVATAAVAGPRYQVTGVVRISDNGSGGWVVEGTLGEVRNSSNDLHRLFCQQSRTETTNSAGAVTRSVAVTCIARNTERTVVCVSTALPFADALNGVSNDALIELHITGSSCTNIIVYQSASTIKKS